MNTQGYRSETEIKATCNYLRAPASESPHERYATHSSALSLQLVYHSYFFRILPFGFPHLRQNWHSDQIMFGDISPLESNALDVIISTFSDQAEL
jgi:hypothetical protein